MDHVLLYMTAGDRNEAEKIARTLVEERLVACVNILGEMTAFFRWEGDVRSGSEIALIAKTQQSLVKKVNQRLVEIHSYDCPCLVALPVSGGHPPFLDWIDTETNQGS